MTTEEIQELFKSTFGSIKDDEKSKKAFIEYLVKSNVISDNEYYDFKQRLASTHLDEKIDFLRKAMKAIPLFEDVDDEIGTEIYYEIKGQLSDCSIVYIYTNKDDDTYIRFNKTYNEIGIARWVDVSSENNTEYDEEFVINSIYDYIQKGYSLERHGKYLDVVDKTYKKYFDPKSMKKKLMDFYIKINGTHPVLDNDWNDYLGYVEKAGIIKADEKIQLMDNNDGKE